MGEISSRWKGVQFARQQLNFGLQIFSRIKSGDFDLLFDEYCEDVDNEQVLDEESSGDDEDCIFMVKTTQNVIWTMTTLSKFKQCCNVLCLPIGTKMTLCHKTPTYNRRNSAN